MWYTVANNTPDIRPRTKGGSGPFSNPNCIKLHISPTVFKNRFNRGFREESRI